MSDNRSQMIDPEQDEQHWPRPEWWSRTPWELRGFRRQNPHLGALWAEIDRTSEAALKKQYMDMQEDSIGATDPGREKSALATDVSKLQQSRAPGQRFRTDEPPGRVSITTELLHGEHEFLKSPESWNKMRRKL